MGGTLKISADNDGRRLDRVLRRLWPQVPLGAIMKAIRMGEVRVDGRKSKGDARVCEGEVITVPWESASDNTAGASRAFDVTPSNAGRLGSPGPKFPPLSTIYRDDDIWIVNKPAGLLTQPDTKYGDSLITRALAELNWSRTDFRPATVQRLDRNTTGAVIIALTGAARRTLSELIREHRIKKIYHAVVEGSIGDEGRIDWPLLKDNEKNIVRADENGQSALTIFRRIAFCGGRSLVEAELVTGRPHQARVHFAAVGHPIVGDRKYGSGEGAKRPLLHARKIIFPNDAALSPNVRGSVFIAPIPADMKKYEGDAE